MDLDEYLGLRRADPTFQLARPVVAATVRPGERYSGGLLISDPVTAKAADLDNVVYELAPIGATLSHLSDQLATGATRPNG